MISDALTTQWTFCLVIYRHVIGDQQLCGWWSIVLW